MTMNDWMKAIQASAPAGFFLDLIDGRTMGMSHRDGTNLDFHFPADDDMGLELYYVRDLVVAPQDAKRLAPFRDVTYEPSIELATLRMKHYLDLGHQSPEQVAELAFKTLFKNFQATFRRVERAVSS